MCLWKTRMTKSAAQGFYILFLLPSAKVICEGYVFTPVCHSVHGVGGVSASMHAGIYTPWADTPPPPGKLPQADTPLTNTPWANTPRVVTSTPVHAGIQCPVHAGIDMATVADGTHPTGMHSCLCCFWSFFVF